MKRSELIFLLSLSLIVLAIMLALLHTLIEPIDSIEKVDWQTKVACWKYAQDHPERSIPLERQEWLREQGMDIEKYDYYTDCLLEKIPIQEKIK